MQLTNSFNGNPEYLRQQLVLVLGESTSDNNWYLNGSQGSITLVNNTSFELSSDDFNSICSQSESFIDWDQKFYIWNTQQKVFEENLSAYAAKCANDIDFAAGTTRSKYTTVAAGQEMTYISKLTECNAYKAAGYPDVTGYPWVEAEALATGLTPQEAADAMILQGAQWAVLGANIEKVRRSGKIELTTLTSIAEMKLSTQATIASLQAI